MHGSFHHLVLPKTLGRSVDHKFHFANEEAEIQMSPKDWNGRMLLEERKSTGLASGCQGLDPGSTKYLWAWTIYLSFSLYKDHTTIPSLRGLAHLR